MLKVGKKIKNYYELYDPFSTQDALRADDVCGSDQISDLIMGDKDGVDYIGEEVKTGDLLFVHVT